MVGLGCLFWDQSLYFVCLLRGLPSIIPDQVILPDHFTAQILGTGVPEFELGAWCVHASPQAPWL